MDQAGHVVVWRKDLGYGPKSRQVRKDKFYIAR